MWRIDRDYLDQGSESRVGCTESHSRIPIIAAVIGMESQDLPVTENQIRFRLKDDDGQLYYAGWLHDDDECLNQEAALSFGMNDAGATMIEVNRDGRWVLEIA